MAHTKCPDCGAMVDAQLDACPECGCPIVHQTAQQQPAPQQSDLQQAAPNKAPQGTPMKGAPAQGAPTTGNIVVMKEKTDWANYFYECGVIGWNTFKSKYCTFTGRASRREFWSFMLIFFIASGTCGFFGIVFLLLYIAVWIRRMHDAGKCGWWSICPIVNWFLLLKKSDEGPNRYGNPFPAREYLNPWH